MWYRTGCGQELINVHSEMECMTRHCVIHNPSAHHMVEWPTYWRDPPGMMERVCRHGYCHPDPDQMTYLFQERPEEEARALEVHVCDGCCVVVAGAVEKGEILGG